MPEIISNLLPVIIGAILGFLSSVITRRFEWKHERRKALQDQQYVLCGDVASFLYALLAFVGEDSDISQEINSVTPRSDDMCWDEIERRWREIEPRLWLLNRLQREKVRELYHNISERSHDCRYQSVLEETETFINNLREDIYH